MMIRTLRFKIDWKLATEHSTIIEMNEISSREPSTTGWQKGRHMRATAWGAESPAPSVSYRALSDPGDIAPDTAQPVWSLHSGLEAGALNQPNFWQLSNGFVFKSASDNAPDLYYFLTGAGSLLGYTRHPVPPTLFAAEREVHEEELLQWLDSGDDFVALARQNPDGPGRFALARSNESGPAAIRAARHLLQTDPEEQLTRECSLRRLFWIQMEEHHAPAQTLAQAYEHLGLQLRGPEGAIAGYWMESTDLAPGAFSVNELTALIAAWLVMDVVVAENLVHTALSLQRSDGSVPAWVHPDGSSADVFAWPLLAHSTLQVCAGGAQQDFLPDVLPKLDRYLQCALSSFSSGPSFGWQTPDAAFIPETYDLELATVDLTVFLLLEVEALLELSGMVALPQPIDTAPFKAARQQLIAQLTEQLWDNRSNCFHDRYFNGTQISRTTLASYLPLLWGDLPDPMCEALLKHIKSRPEWKAGHGIPLWEHWDTDEVAPDIRVVHQAFLAQALRASGRTSDYVVYAEHIQDRMADLAQTEGIIPHILNRSAQMEPGDQPSSTVGAALLVDLEREHTALEQPEVELSPLMKWLDQNRIPILAGVTSLVVIAIFAITLIFMYKRAPTGADADAMMSVAQRHYDDKNYEEAIKVYRSLLEVARRPNEQIHLRLGNAYFRRGDFDAAEKQYLRTFEINPDAPASLRNLAILHFRAGNTERARQYFEQIAEEYGHSYPHMARQAQHALDVLNEIRP